jgi:peptide/nickel transport system substrate-binding protein
MTALAPIEQYMATQLPVIPTIVDAGFDEYSDANFTGWPSASNPYANSVPNAISNEVVILHLKPRS